MTDLYSESKELLKIIESKGWNLYDTSDTIDPKGPTLWNQLEKRGPVEVFEMGKNYIFAPKQENGLSLRDTYAITKGLGPSLLIEDINDDRWEGLEVSSDFYARGEPIRFSRLGFYEDLLVALTPPSRENPKPDIIGISYSQAIDTFNKYYRIITPEELGYSTPIPMTFNVEDN